MDLNLWGLNVMRKRLRKKLHLKEFQELGFEITCSFVPNFSDADFDSFIDEFIDEAIERNGLQFGGGGDRKEWRGFVALDHRGMVTEAHRTKVSDWLASRTEITEYQVGNLVDAWHGWEDQCNP